LDQQVVAFGNFNSQQASQLAVLMWRCAEVVFCAAPFQQLLAGCVEVSPTRSGFLVSDVFLIRPRPAREPASAHAATAQVPDVMTQSSG